MSVDQYDKSLGWTIQDGSLAEIDPEVNDPGMVYHRSQLPDPDVAKAAGIPPQPEPIGVYDDAAAAVEDPNGPLVEDLHWLKWDDLKNKIKNELGRFNKDDNKDEDVNTAPVDSLNESTGGGTQNVPVDNQAPETPEVHNEAPVRSDEQPGDPAPGEQPVPEPGTPQEPGADGGAAEPAAEDKPAE